jgi:hypothetical protein
MEELSQHPERWEAIDPEQLCQFAYAEILRYGVTNDESLVPRLMRLYGIVARRASRDQRQQLKDYVTEALSDGVGSCNALMPLIFAEPDVWLISSAALDLAVLLPLQDDDPLTGPRYLRYLAEELSPDQDARTGILAGLLALGDMRTLPILDGCWELLDEEHRHLLANARQQSIYASAIEFVLNWLDACLESGDDDLFGTVAAFLASAGLYGDQVVDFERKYPLWAPDERPVIRVTQQWSIGEYGQIIAPRLRDLLQREPEPKVMPHVMQYWGVDVETPLPAMTVADPDAGSRHENSRDRQARRRKQAITKSRTVNDVVDEIFESIVAAPKRQRRLLSKTFWGKFGYERRTHERVAQVSQALRERNIVVNLDGEFGSEDKDDWLVLSFVEYEPTPVQTPDQGIRDPASGAGR